MSWQFGLKKKKYEDVYFYELCEIYGGAGYTGTPIEIDGDSPEDVIELLELILDDLKNNLEIVDDTKEVNDEQ